MNAFASGASKLKPTKLQLEALEDVGIIEPGSFGGSMPKQPCRSNKGAHKVVGGAKKPASAWIQHVQRFWKANGGSYKDAMKNAKASYKK